MIRATVKGLLGRKLRTALTAFAIVLGVAFGGMRSLRRGTGSDVAGSRPYRPGDPIDHID